MRLRRVRAEVPAERLEQLLLGARDWEPVEQAPEGLLARALENRPLRSAIRRPGLSAVAVVGSVALCVVTFCGMARHLRGVGSETTQRVADAVAYAPAPPITGSVEPRGIAEAAGVAVAAKATAPRRALRQVAPAGQRRVAKRPKASDRIDRRRASPVWRDYTVRRYVSGLSTPGYVATPSEDGSAVLLPAVAEVDLGEHVGRWSTDAVKPVDYVPVRYQSEGDGYD